MKNIVIAFLVLSLISGPALAKSVSLDVKEFDDKGSELIDPGKQFHKHYKQYYIEARKAIENHWVMLDPMVGRTVKIHFWIRPDGQLINIIGAPHNNQLDQLDKLAYSAASLAVIKASPLPALPINNNKMMVVFASFKSRRPAPNSNLDSNQIMNGLMAAGLIAAVGFGIWALIKASNDSNNNSSMDYEWVNYPHTRADGTFSPGYYRSKRDGTVLNNWSTKGNINPFTGQPGYVTP